MNRKRDIAAIVVAFMAVIFIAVIMGCTSAREQSQQRPTWGQGDPPPNWTKYFGNDNGARIDYKQSVIIDEIAKRLRVLEINQYIPDPNGVK